MNVMSKCLDFFLIKPGFFYSVTSKTQPLMSARMVLYIERLKKHDDHIETGSQNICRPSMVIIPIKSSFFLSFCYSINSRCLIERVPPVLKVDYP